MKSHPNVLASLGLGTPEPAGVPATTLRRGGRIASPAAQDSRPRIKKAVMYGMIAGKLSVLEKFRIAKHAGFDGVEMDSPSRPQARRSARGPRRDRPRDPGRRRLGALEQDARRSRSEGARAKGVAALETALRDCKRYRRHVACCSCPPSSARRSRTPTPGSARRPRSARCSRSPQELGVKIAIENVWNQFLLSPLEAARYVDEFESPRVGWHFDIGNVVNYGWPEQWIRILGKRIKKLHIKEFSRKKRDDEGLWKGFDVELGDRRRLRLARRAQGARRDRLLRLGRRRGRGGDEARLARRRVADGSRAERLSAGPPALRRRVLRQRVFEISVTRDCPDRRL